MAWKNWIIFALCSLGLLAALFTLVSAQTQTTVPISKEELTSITWQFGRGDGSLISNNMHLNPDGTISGYSHPNEHRWGVEGNEILFYREDNQVATRFNTFETVGGKWVIQGPFMFPTSYNPIHVLKQLSSIDLPISKEELTSITWQFGRGDGSVISNNMHLNPDGTISGYSHPNEHRWGVEGNEILFYREDSQVATRFNTFETVGGKWVIQGPFMFPTSYNPIHVLKQLN